MKINYNLWQFLNKRRKIQFLLLVILMLVGSLAEIISIGLTLPFLASISSPDLILEYDFIKYLRIFIDIDSIENIILLFTALFIGAAVLSGAIRFFLNFSLIRFSFGIGADFNKRLYLNTLFIPYEEFKMQNSSEYASSILKKSENTVTGVLLPILYLINSALVISSVVILLIKVDPMIAFSIFASFGLLYLIITLYFQRRLKANGAIISKCSSDVIKNIQEGYGNIRNVILDQKHKYYLNIFHRNDIQLRRAYAESEFISSNPKFILESLGMIIIAILAYDISINSSNSASISIPLIGTFAIAAQRVLPLVQQAYNAFSRIRSSQASHNDVVNLLRIKVPSEEFLGSSLKFKERLLLKEVSFGYKKSNSILNKVSLEVFKGETVGLIGKTGTGKSTLLDIMLGLIFPSSGEVYIDDSILDDSNIFGWYKNVAQIPQRIYLADETILKNIALGEDEREINIEKVKRAAKIAEIHEEIMNFSKGYSSITGENGSRLSGGQIQRIGIARAIYSNKKFLVLDEATSALDFETEKRIMANIKNLKNVTTIMVAHRLSSLKECDRIFKIDSGKLSNVSDKEYKRLLELTQR